ncbi:GIY-YIG nuclease family protein [Halobacillus litoralis]|uniref:GIY-YIG nuclease family protein n=1 Tax=Halobacillus litoralis TaxID=45668 RepID=UPI001CD7063F|nr:GIY-YIG nuclease family protein [Halobacillus litoralis]MCA0972731.1 GIY-YIG nuclease family protein [Halobacillus litoralis]
MADNHYVYVLRCKDHSLYTGYTNDLTKRIQKHESGKGAKYTRGRGPFELEIAKTFDTKQEAMKAEYRIKQMSRAQKEKWLAEARGGDADESSKKFF